MIDKHLLKELQPYKQKAYAAALLDAVLAAAVIARCYCLADIIDKMLFSRLSLRAAVPQLALLLLLFLAEAGSNLGVRLITHKISVNIRRRIRYAFIRRLAEGGPLAVACGTDIIQTAAKGVDSLDAYFSRFLPQLAAAIIMPAAIIPVAFYQDWISGLIFLLTLPLIPFFMMLIGRKAQTENNRQWLALTRLSSLFMELLSGMAVIKIYNQTKLQLEKTVEAGNEFSRAVLKVLRVAFLSAFFLELIATLSIAIIAVNMGFRLLYGQASFLPGFFILLMAPEFYKPLRQTGSMFHDAMGALANTAKIYGMIGESAGAAGSAAKTACLQRAPRIVFEAVEFQYSDKRENALCGADIDFAAGKITALVGRSGAGKSTVLSLLLRFAAPDRGRILVDGTELSSLEKRSWRKSIAYVPQQTHIFNMSIRENICMGRAVAAERLQEAAEKAGLGEMLRAMPRGLDTVVGNGGKGLSYGQMRRIALARVFLSDAAVLLLDEPTEGLDTVTENIVQKGIAELSAQKTVIIIAHRLASIKNADEIYVLSRGKTAEHGSDQYLRRNKGLYYKMLEGMGGASV